MGLDTFPLLQNHICLITDNNIIFKLKLEYQEISEQKREAFVQVVSEQTAHSQIEDVCRNVLYNIERKEELSPIQTDNFIIYPEVCKWPLCKKMQFTNNGRKLSCHRDLILLKLICKDVDVSGPGKGLAGPSTSKLGSIHSHDRLEVRATSKNQAKTNTGNKNTEREQCTNNSALLGTPEVETDQVREDQSNQQKEKVNIMLSVEPCRELLVSDSELRQSGSSNKLIDIDTSNSTNHCNNHDELCNSNLTAHTNAYNKEVLMPVRITRSESQKRQYLQNTIICEGLVEQETNKLISQSKLMKVNNKAFGSIAGNMSTALKYQGSVKKVKSRYKNNKAGKIHNVKEGATNQEVDTIKKYNIGLEMSDTDVVEISDGGSIIYESDRMNSLEDVTSVTPDTEAKSYNRNKKKEFSSKNMDRLQKSRDQAPKSALVRKQKQISSVERRTEQNIISNCDTLARKQGSSNTKIFKEGQTHAMNHSNEVAGVSTFNSHTNIAQNTRGKLSSVRSVSPRITTRSLSGNPSRQETKWSCKTLQPVRTSRSHSSKLGKRINHTSKGELSEAKRHLRESKDGVWLFW